MSSSPPQPQSDGGCLGGIAKIILGIVMSLAVSFAFYWGINDGKEVASDLFRKASSALRSDSMQDQPSVQTASQPAPQPTATTGSILTGATLVPAHHLPTPKPVPTELDKMTNADWLRSRHRNEYNTIKDLPWVRDGLTQQEAKTAQALLYTAANDIATLRTVLSLQWISDGITSHEARATIELMFLSKKDPSASQHLAGMSFLDSVAEADALLISALNGRAFRSGLIPFMAHPAIADGIEDHEVVLTTAAATIDAQEHAARILTPGNATIETIQTATRRTSPLTISVVRAGTRSSAKDTTLIVEDGVAFIEDLMNRPLPVSHVIILLDDSGVLANYVGINYGEAIAYTRRGEDGSDHDRLSFIKGLVHELAHYYWRGNENWIDEGMANTIEHIYARSVGLPPEYLYTKRTTCTLPHLQALSQMNPGTQHPQFQCNYYLGETLFLELLHALGPDRFWHHARNLYQQTLPFQNTRETPGYAHVQAAFTDSPQLLATHWTGAAPLATQSTPSRAAPSATPAPPIPLPTAVRARPATPLPASTVQPLPTAEPWPTPITIRAATRPTPVPISAATPIPLPTAPPTSVPTATPLPQFVPYHDTLWHETALMQPYGWTTSNHADHYILRPPGADSKAQLRIQRHPISADGSIAQLFDHYQQDWLAQARTWHHYENISTTGEFRDATNYIQIIFDRQTTPDNCPEHGVTHLYRSSFFPQRLAGYSVTMTICRDALPALADKRPTVMDSFTERP